MLRRVVQSFLHKKAALSFTKKLAIAILDEVLGICENLKDKAENADLLIKDAQFVKDKISQSTDDEDIKRRMSNLRDQVALRVDFMRDDANTSADRKAIQRLDIFTYKTS